MRRCSARRSGPRGRTGAAGYRAGRTECWERVGNGDSVVTSSHTASSSAFASSIELTTSCTGALCGTRGYTRGGRTQRGGHMG